MTTITRTGLSCAYREAYEIRMSDCLRRSVADALSIAAVLPSNSGSVSGRPEICITLTIASRSWMAAPRPAPMAPAWGMSKLGGQETAKPAPDGAVYLIGGPQTRIRTGNFRTGLAVVDAIGAVVEEMDSGSSGAGRRRRTAGRRRRRC
ncbi:hypothetical protein [Actinoplanes teichomyceticus]|nr:hypothetical protein [Actinoplanes teichomyceticus]